MAKDCHSGVPHTRLAYIAELSKSRLRFATLAQLCGNLCLSDEWFTMRMATLGCYDPSISRGLRRVLGVCQSCSSAQQVQHENCLTCEHRPSIWSSTDSNQDAYSVMFEDCNEAGLEILHWD